MKRILQLLLLTLLATSAWANFCNNPVPPCATDDPLSPCYKPDDPPPKCEPEVCGKCQKSPCHVGSGVYTFEVVDLKINTTGMPIQLSRRYQSTHAIDGENGYGWVSSLSARLHYAVYLKSAPSTYSKEANVRMPDGALYRFVENADGSFTPPEGRFDTLVQNGDGTWDLWLQRTRSRLHFSSTGDLLQMIDDYGNTLTWTYANDRLQRIEDTSGSGRYIDVTYGADGRVSDVTDLTGRNVQYTYDSSGVMTSATNPAGQAVTYAYTAGKYVPLLNAITDHWGRNVTNVVYDPQDRVVSYTEKGETYTYTYGYNGVATTTAKTDSSGNRWIYPFGTGGLVTDSLPPGGGAGEHIDYYASGLPQLKTDAVGVKTHYVYNTLGNPTSITYDYEGPTAVRWDYVYDATYPNNVLTVTPRVPATNQVHPHWQGEKYDYYGPGSPAPGALHHTYEVESDGVTSRVLKTMTYDAHGRVLTVTEATNAVTTYAYDAFGNLQSITHPPNNDAAIQPVTTFTADTLGRMLSETDANGAVSTFTWDVLDRPSSITLPRPFPGSTLTFTTTYYYDEYDTTNAVLVRRVVDPNGFAWRLGFDQYGQLLRVTDQVGNVTRFTRVKGLLTSRIDPNNYTVTYGYDARRRLSTVTYGDGSYEQYGFNADGTYASKRDRGNQTMTFGYDRFKRMVTKTYPNGGVITSTFLGQKQMSVSDTFSSPSETSSTTYDASFRVTSQTQGTRGAVSYTYTADNRRATQSVAGAATTTYGYYPDGSVRTIAWSPVSGTFKFDYTLTGQTQTITFPNGQTRSYGYDDQGRVTQVANVHPSAGNLATFAYGYDVDPFTSQANRLGRRTTVAANVPALGLTNALTRYAYDTLYQLTRADYPGGDSATWTYDANGNRTSASLNGTVSTFTYNTFGGNALNSEQLQSDGAAAFTYDANGSRTARTATGASYTYSHDYEKRLRSINGAVAAGYSYDFRGRRTVRTVNGAMTTFVYSDLDLVAENGAASAEYVYAPGIDAPLAMVRNGTVYYYDVDALGSVVAVNDAAGNVSNSYAYDAWGTFRARNETVANPFGFAARETGEGGYNYNRTRYYDPSIGAFESVDLLIGWTAEAYAIGKRPLPGAFPEYRYADNQPTMARDPLGLAPDYLSCRKGCMNELKTKMLACLRSLQNGQLGCIAIAAGCAGATGPAAVLACTLAYATCELLVWENYFGCEAEAQMTFRACVLKCACL